MRTLVLSITLLAALGVERATAHAQQCGIPSLGQCRSASYQASACYRNLRMDYCFQRRCAAPTSAECGDPAFIATCDWIAGGAPQCSANNATTFQNAWNADPSSLEPVLQPNEMIDQRTSGDDTSAAGLRVQAKKRHYPLSTTRSEQPASSGFTGQRILNTLGTVGATRLLTPGALFTTPWTLALMADPTVTSCKDYVVKKWYDYAIFEQDVAACGNDRECVYQAAIHPTRGIAKTLRKFDVDREPMEHQIQLAPGIHLEHVFPRNSFFSVSPREILSLAGWMWTDPQRPELEALLAATDPVTPTAVRRDQRFQWHRNMHDAWAALGLTLEEQDDALRRTGDYAKLVDEYRKLLLALNVTEEQKQIAASYGWSEALDMYSPHNQFDSEKWRLIGALDAVIRDMANRLLAEWRHVRSTDGTGDRGCLGASVACDWSLVQFKSEYVGRWQPEREADMVRCNANTGGNFAVIDPSHREDVDDFDLWMFFEELELEQITAGLPWKSTQNATTQELQKSLRWGIPSIHEEHGQPDLFYAKYDQAAFVELGASALNANGRPRVCAITGALFGELRAELHWWDTNGPHKPVLFDAQVSAGLERDRPLSDADVAITRTNLATPGKVFDAHAHFYVMDTQVFAPVNESLAPGQRWEAVKFRHTFVPVDFVQRFAIGPIPAYARVMVTATPSLDTTVSIPAFEAGGHTCLADAPGEDAGRLSPVTHRVQADILARAQVDAKGYLAIGIPGLSAGVKGTINVLDAQLPAMASLGFTGDLDNLYLTFNTWGELHTRLLGGTISAFAEALFLQWEAEVFRWDPIKIDTDLWRYETSLPILKVANIFTGSL